MNIHIVNGPNLNMIDRRDSTLYGGRSFDEVRGELTITAKRAGHNVEFYQSNCEGELINYLQLIKPEDALVINAGAYTHTSLAIADCLEYLTCIKIEVHLTNIQSREVIRQRSLIAGKVTGSISGFGLDVYLMAVQYLCGKLDT